jgi:hypothetical protein
MGVAIAVGCFALLIILVAFGRAAMVEENDKRVTEWARKQGVVLIRVDRDIMFQAQDRPLWRIRVRKPDGEVRDAIVRAGWSIYDGVEVEWAKPGDSVFR